ncbi:MAG TPA: redoxin domain-containing protein [Saprospiraceae bacterium]|nr:redoxin domain-containing protein [Saprospiraceae bacterium]
MEDLDKEVEIYHENLAKNNPNSFAAMLAKARTSIVIPEFKGQGTEDEIKMKRYLFYKKHYFDNFKMDDPRMLRSPELFKRIDYYIKNLTPQHPDSINVSLDRIFNLIEGSEETFRYYLSHYLNEYAKSKIVGMDAVYVHLVENYYAKGKAPWVDEESLKKITDNARTLKPILVGKIAPNIKVYKRDNEAISLHDIKSKYTILVFWQPDCGHCKKSMPVLKEIYEKYKDKGVEVLSICTKKYDKDKKMEEVEKCWKFLDEHEMNKWINAVDPFIRSRYAQIYDIRSTPRIFILDAKKEIIVKGIGKDQLDEVLDQIIENDQKKQEHAMEKK